MTADTPTGPDAVLRELQWVRRLARRLLADAALADDVAQDTWLAAREGLPRDDGGKGALRRWLATVVRNRARRLLRGDRRRIVREQALVAMGEAAEASDPADVVARVALHTEVAQAVAALEEPYRSALSWHYLDELPATEVARRQGVHHDAARKRISRGLHLLRLRLAHVHPGGFAAWCVDWTRALDPVGIAGAGAATTSWFAVILMKKWLLLSSAAAVALWFAWPLMPNVPAPQTTELTQTPEARSSALPAARPDAVTERVGVVASTVGMRLVGDAGRPSVGVHVLALHAGALVARGLTDADGRVAFAAPLHADEWLLAREGAVPVRRARAEAVDEELVALSDGVTVTGELRDGSRLVTSLRLEHDRASPLFAGLDAAVVAALASLGIRADGIDVPIDGNQHFRCIGLPPSWSGAISAPAGYTLHEPSRRGFVEGGGLLLLLRPTDDLVLELVPPIWVRGRVLAGGIPAPGLRAWASSIDEESVPQPTITDADGRFAVPVQAPRGDRAWAASLRVCGEVAGELLRMPLPVPSSPADLDVGDLALDGPLQVLVQNDAGEPLAGARVSVGGAQFASCVTDAAGRAGFAATALGADRVLVHAEGHRTERREVPKERRLTVRLVPTNELVVHAVAADGGMPAAALALQITAERPFLRDPSGEAKKDDEGGHRLLLTLDEHGQARVGDLVPGVLVELAVRDDLGQLVAQRVVTTPLPGQCTTVELATSAQVLAFRGVVRDAQGRAVPRARLHIEADGFAMHGRTDADGRFALGPVREAMRAAYVEVVHPAFVAWVRSDFALDIGSPPLDIVLEAGREVEVQVVQQSGAPLPAGEVQAELEGGGGLAGRLAPGRYRFERLAQRAGRVYVRLGGREFSAPLGAIDEFIELRVPDVGAVQVSLGDAVERRGVRLCVAATELGNEGAGDRSGKVTERDYFRDGQPPVRTLWLPAGRYRLQLEKRRMGQRGFEVLGERVVEVHGGDTLEVALP